MLLFIGELSGFAIPYVLGIVWYAQWLEKKYPGFTSQTLMEADLQAMEDHYRKGKADKSLPGLGLSLLSILVPIILVFIKAILSTFPQLPGLNSPTGVVLVQVVGFVGTPIIALAISTLLAVYSLVPHLDRQAATARLEEGLQSAGIILLVTGAGRALGTVVRDSGAGIQLAGQVAHLPISPVMIPFLVATLVRLIQGSGTVAIITSAPILAHIPGVNLLFAAQAAAMGAFFFSYFNDSLFWSSIG